MSEFNFTAAPPLSLYVHIPWCVRKCPYCDFNSYAARGKIPENAYLEALLRDLDNEISRIQGRVIESVFIGGGTPSLFSPRTLGRLISALSTRRLLAANAEVTLEANPGAIEQHRFVQLLRAGVNRLSIGVQSFNDAALQTIGRIHDGADALHAVQIARTAGFDNVNVDLIYGLPGQSIQDCHADLITAIRLEPEHISYYQLTVEPNTLFYASPPSLPDDGVLWKMHLVGNGTLRKHGYTQYEVSAYSRQNRRCRHNMNYWQFGDYLGIGAGAHGKLTSVTKQEIRRSWKAKQPKRYIESVRKDAVYMRRLSKVDVVSEFMLNALRLRKGVALALFRERTGLSLNNIEQQLQRAFDLGLLYPDAKRLIPTELGQRYLDDLIMLFLPESTH